MKMTVMIITSVQKILVIVLKVVRMKLFPANHHYNLCTIDNYKPDEGCTVIPDLNVSLILAILKLVVKPNNFIVTIIMHAPRMSVILIAVVHLLRLNAMITLEHGANPK